MKLRYNLTFKDKRRTRQYIASLAPVFSVSKPLLRNSAMYAIEFETDITGNFIELKDYEQLLNKHAKVIVLVDEMNKETEQPITQTIKQLQQFNEIISQRCNLPMVSKEIDINTLCNEINRDIF